MAARSRHRQGVLETSLGARVLEDQRRVHELDRLEVNVLGREVDAVEFQPVDDRKAPPDRFEIAPIDVHSHYASGDGGIDSRQAIAAGDAEDGDRGWPARDERVAKQLGQRAELFHALHVPFVVVQRHVEPGIRHGRSRSSTITCSTSDCHPWALALVSVDVIVSVRPSAETAYVPRPTI
jgi:hypothetical protein